MSFDDGSLWQRLGEGLPVVPVHDLVLKDGDLVVATHGRSFWILDNVAVLSLLDEAAVAAPVHVFEPRKTIRFGRGATATARFSSMSTADGENPPNGVVIPYYFEDVPGGEVTLRILDGNGIVRSFTSTAEEEAPRTGFFGGSGGDRTVSAEQGANTFRWDMRYAGADVLSDAVFQGRSDGPLAAPGSYRVEISVNGKTFSQSFEFVRDPRLELIDADLDEQFNFLIDVRDKLTETMNVVRRIRDLRERATEAVERAGGSNEVLFFTLNREDFSFVIHLDRQPRTSRRREAQTGSRARSGSRSERTLDAVEHSRTLMEWWPFLIFHRGGLRIKVINNTEPELADALRALNDKLYPLEERLVQYRARAGQDLINYPTAIGQQTGSTSQLCVDG